MSVNVKNISGGTMALALFAISICAANSDLRLVKAVKDGDKEATASLLKQNVDVNAAQADGSTALHWAAYRDDLPTADLLIGAGANPNAASEYGATPLSMACDNGSSAMVEKLLKAGANANVALASGETALMTCAGRGSQGAVKALLAHGADVNARETKGSQTALMWAVAEKHPEIVRMLIEHGADIHARSNAGLTPLLFAAQQGDLASLQMLIEAGADINEATPATANPQPTDPKKAVEYSKQFRGTPGGTTPLLMAVASGHEAMAAFLLDKGADAKAADVFGFTALHYAVWGRNMSQVMDTLLARGANPNARLTKEPPLGLLGLIGGKRFRTLASDQGSALANDGSPSFLGITPLWLAAQIGNVRAIRTLLAHGADPKIGTEAGVTPLMAAAGVGRLVAWMSENRASALEEGRSNLEAVKLLLEVTGEDVNEVGQNGWTALHGAAYTLEDDIIRFLVQKDAKMDLMDRFGQTPLSIASAVATKALTAEGVNYTLFAQRQFQKSTVDLLLSLGAKPLERSGVAVFDGAAATGANSEISLGSK